MNVEEAKQMIIEYVTNVQGCKLTQLVCEKFLACDIRDVTDPIVLVDDMIANGELVGISYTTPTLPYREKLFLLPPGALFTTISKNQRSHNE